MTVHWVLRRLWEGLDRGSTATTDSTATSSSSCRGSSSGGLLELARATAWAVAASPICYVLFHEARNLLLEFTEG